MAEAVCWGAGGHKGKGNKAGKPIDLKAEGPKVIFSVRRHFVGTQNSKGKVTGGQNGKQETNETRAQKAHCHAIQEEGDKKGREN